MMTNYILEYYQAIKDGTETAGEHIIRIYELIIKGLKKKSFFYDAKKAQRAIKFIQAFSHHNKGELAPGRLKLELWQKALISLIFGIVDEEGKRQFREVFIVIGRKQGKTLLASAISEYCAYGLGEYGGEIYFIAPKLDQASICFDAFTHSVNQEELLRTETKKRRTDLYVESTNTTIKPIAFSSKKSDGFNVSIGVCDEIASWQGDNGLKMYEVLKSSQGARREPLLISITTAGYINEGIFDELMKRSTRYLLGESKEQRLLPVIYMIDDPGKWSDLNELKKSNPNLNVSTDVDYLLEEIAVAEGSLSKKAEFLTKYCNIKQNSSQAWLSADAVRKACGKKIDPEEFREHYAVGGIDLSRTTDLTACCLVIEKNGILNVLSKFFLPSEKIEEAIARDGLPYNIFIQKGWLELSGENVIDYRDCLRWFAEMVEKHRILPLQTGYDRYSAQYLVQEMKAYGFHMDDVFQGYNLTPIIREFEGLIKDGKINIGDNDLMKVHLLNAALKQDNQTDRAKLIKIGPTDHIDGTAALIDALTVRAKWHSEIGQQLKNIRE